MPWVDGKRRRGDPALQWRRADGGTRAGKALTGETNAFGKLPISFAHHAGQLPVYHNQLPGWHGDRYVDMPAEPLYAFGYGLELYFSIATASRA